MTCPTCGHVRAFDVVCRCDVATPMTVARPGAWMSALGTFGLVYGLLLVVAVVMHLL